MTARAYYNEIDPFAAAWLRALIAANHIAPGDVDERSIEHVSAGDLVGYTQCHFFAGIGVWSAALRDAGWADTTPVWTGSCPCQPFSASGKGEGFDDRRHLWPVWHRLILERRPDVCFGEQVAGSDGLSWFDVVSADLERAGYAIGAADLCAAGLGAPHIRQRLYFVADAHRDGVGQHARELPRDEGQHEVGRTDGDHTSLDRGAARGMADTDTTGRANARPELYDAEHHTESRGELGDTDRAGRRGGRAGEAGAGSTTKYGSPRSSAARGFWVDAEWISCIDGKARPVEPGTFPLAHGAPARVGRLRGYGNALCKPVAQAFIEAYLDVAGGVIA